MSQEKLVKADDLWAYIDSMQKNLDQAVGDVETKNSDAVKLVIYGKREMIKGVADWLYDNQLEFSEFCDLIGYEIRSVEDS